MADVDEVVGVLSSRERDLVCAAAEAGGPVHLFVDPESRDPEESSRSGWPEGVPLPTQEEVSALASLGVVDEVYRRQGWGLQVNFVGRRVAAQIRRERELAVGAIDPGALAWSAVEPHRRSVYEAWLRTGGPVGVGATSLRDLEPATRSAIVNQLLATELLTRSPAPLVRRGGAPANGSAVGEETLAPSPKTISEYNAWPSTAEGAHAQLIAALEAAIAQPGTAPAERSRLEGIRDQVQDLAVGTAWTVMTSFLGGAV